MPRTTKDQTRRKLRDAVVSEAVEMGFPQASIAGVVRRARVSAGTIYVHFENKDDMLRKVYMEVKSDFHARLLAAHVAPDSAAMIRQMWFAMFDFVTEKPEQFLFLDYGSAAKILTPEQQQVVDGYAADIAELMRRGVNDGTLAPVETGILSLLLTAPAMQLARQSVISGRPVPQDILETTFERVWRSIKSN